MRARQMPLLLFDALGSPLDDLTPVSAQLARIDSPELELARVAVDLGAAGTGGPLSPTEGNLIERTEFVGPAPPGAVDEAGAAILEGEDPLGDAFCRIRGPATRRDAGAFYTPSELVGPMLDWVLGRAPERLIDPGCGSGRFAAGAVRRRPDLAVVAIDLDPLATLLARGTLAVLKAQHSRVLHADYTGLRLPPIAGRSAFVGNPPYVRHHDLSASLKARAARTARQLGYALSGLAGLHAYFYLATAAYARPGDAGCFVTSAEWLDVNYGSIIRDLLLDGLGGQRLHVIDPRAVPFEDSMATAVIVCFEVGSRPDPLRIRLVESSAELQDLESGREVSRAALTETQRWTPLLQEHRLITEPRAKVPLGVIARVHRGVATGANEFFIVTRERARQLGVEPWCRPAITKAGEILKADGVVRDGAERRLLLEVPRDINLLTHPELEAYLRRGEREEGGRPAVSARYLARNRRPWWHLGPPASPPIVVTYMARQAPLFALNPDGLAVVNVAHGLYPREKLSQEQLAALVACLNGARDTFRGNGRTYHGGLEKFEPREVEALSIPTGVWC